MINYGSIIKISRAISKNASDAAFDKEPTTWVERSEDWESEPLKTTEHEHEVEGIWDEHDSAFSSDTEIIDAG